MNENIDTKVVRRKIKVIQSGNVTAPMKIRASFRNWEAVVELDEFVSTAPLLRKSQFQWRQKRQKVVNSILRRQNIKPYEGGC